jgi:hypothetical protein
MPKHKKDNEKKKGRGHKDQPPDKADMGKRFDKAMTKVANAPWPPPKK